MTAIDELVQFAPTRWAPPLRCSRGHLVRVKRTVN
jgi:hypothetical protein